MQNNLLTSIEQILKKSFPDELVTIFLEAYNLSMKEFKKESWKHFGNEIGQFIEICIRMVDYSLFKSYTPIDKKLSIFDTKYLIKWENVQGASEEWKIIIPRVLYSMYCIRNKRGMIHKNHISPNKMDATILTYNMKWVISEIIRLHSVFSFEKTEQIIENIIQKEIPITWDIKEKTRVLNLKLKYSEQIILLLYKKNGLSRRELLEFTEYSNGSGFDKILRELHKRRYI